MRDITDRQEYINTILEQINSKRLRKEIEKELSAHIDDREQYYREIGYDSETAAQKALEHMGSPEAAADGLSKVHIHSRSITVALTVLLLLSSAFAHICFWLIIIFNIDDSTMGAGITEAMFLMYVIGLSVIGKRRNSSFICFVAIIDFIIMYVRYFFEVLYLNNNIYEVCSRIVLKLACLLTGDYESLFAFWQVGGITVTPYLTYLSIAFYAVVFILLLLVMISVGKLKKPTYGLRTKQFAARVFKAQKRIWIFIAATILILPVYGHFDKNDGMTVKTNSSFSSVIIAQSDTPRPLSEIPKEDILIFDLDYDWSVYAFSLFSYFRNDSEPKNIICTEGDSIEGISVQKELGNKFKYKVLKFTVPCIVTENYVYVEFVSDNTNTSSEYFADETAYKFTSVRSENWYKTESTSEISAAVDAYSQVEIVVQKAP